MPKSPRGGAGGGPTAATEDVDDDVIVEYVDGQGKDATPIPLYIPDEAMEKEAARESAGAVGKAAFNRTKTVISTFLKMTSAIYTMAGLGSVEESKLYREQTGEDEGTTLLFGPEFESNV